MIDDNGIGILKLIKINIKIDIRINTGNIKLGHNNAGRENDRGFVDKFRYNRPVGDSRFCDQIAKRYDIVLPQKGRGRPRKREDG